MDKILEPILDEHCPIKLPVMEMLYICTVHVATEHLECA